MAKDMSSAEATERRLASRELGRARRSIQAIRSFYIANAILWGVALLLMLGASGSGMVKAGLGVGFLVMVAGVLQIAKNPFLWSVLIASLWTLLVVAALLGGARVASLYFLLSAAWTLGCWIMLPTTVRVKRLLDEHPDLWIARKMRPQGRGRRRGRPR